MNKKALVTGSAGFLGSFLSEKLLDRGYEVIGIDNFFRGKRNYLPSNESFKFYEIDLAEEPKKTKKVMEREEPNFVFHYAAINGTKYFYDIPYKVFSKNIRMTQNVLQAVQATKTDKIIYASSSEVYGSSPKIPTPEEHPIVIKPQVTRDSYAASKAFSEFYVRLFSAQREVDHLILRIFNTYGPRMDTSEYGQVIPEFIRKVYSDDQFTIIGDGKQTRAFCYVNDHTRLALQLAEEVSNEIVNIGTDHKIEIKKLAREVHKVIGEKFQAKHLPPRDHDPRHRCPKITKLRDLTGSKPKIRLEEGLKKTVNWYQSIFD